MTALRQSLSKLDRAVVKLEGSVGSLQRSLTGKQRDMFGLSGKKAAKAKANGNDTPMGSLFESGLVARRLDNAIEKVEELLGER